MTIAFDKKSGKYSFTAPTGKVYSSPNKKYVEWRAAQFSGQVEEAAETEQTSKYSINERFEFISNFVTMVADKIQPAIIVAGSGGLGKTHTVIKTLKSTGLVDVSNVESFTEGSKLPAKRFKVVKGYTTAKGLFRLLWENKDSVLVLDDCDQALRDEVASNLLKAACDTSDERIITWNAESRFGDDDLPRSFRFTGGVIFITNMSKAKIPQAMLTRSIVVDVSMTAKEKLERMAKIAFEPDFMPEASANVKKVALDSLYKYQADTKELSLRSLIQVVRIAQKYEGKPNFEKMVDYALTN